MTGSDIGSPFLSKSFVDNFLSFASGKTKRRVDDVKAKNEAAKPRCKTGILPAVACEARSIVLKGEE